jgi:hypothetical protein
VSAARRLAITAVCVATRPRACAIFALAEQRFGGGVDARHLARCGTGRSRVIRKAVGMMFTCEAPARRAHLGVARPRAQPEKLVRRWATRRCSRHTLKV